MKCPECGSNHISAYMQIRGYAWVDLKLNSVNEDVEDCNYNQSDVKEALEYHCNACFIIWEN